MAFDDSNIEGQIGEQMYIDYLKDKVKDHNICRLT